MNLFTISSIAALALVTVAGCAGSTDESPDSTQDELTSRPKIELASSRDAASVQAKLYNLMETFKGEADLGIVSAIESASLKMSGGHEAGVRSRSVTCDSSSIEAVGPGGSGFTQITMFDCVLEGFDKVRNGAVLPSVVVPFDGDQPLAGKIFDLLSMGEKKGSLGVERMGSSEHPPCCDMPTSVTYSITDDVTSLSCTMHGGGFTGIRHVECTFAHNDSH